MDNLFNNIGLLLLTITLGGCSEPDVHKQSDSIAFLTASTVNAAKALNYEKFTKPTTVPTTNIERQALLKSLNIKTDSTTDERRLALFVRYTYFANSQDRQLNTLEQLVGEIAKMRKSRPDDHELTALYGSATCLQTVFFLDNLGKTNLLSKKGSRYLDSAVKSAPNHLGVRLYRGITYAEMPAFLGKGRQAVADFTLIKSATDSQTDEKFTAMVDYYYAMALLKNQQQKNGLELLAALVDKTIVPWSERAATLLKDKG